MKKIILLLFFVIASLVKASAPFDSSQGFNLWQVEQFKQIEHIARTIKFIESRGNYQIKGASGEYGAYQYMPGIWEFWCIELFGEVLDITIPEVQDYVTYCRIEQYVDEGYSNEQIASLWNSQKPDWEGRIGVNRWGVPYSVPAYVARFISKLNET